MFSCAAFLDVAIDITHDAIGIMHDAITDDVVLIGKSSEPPYICMCTT